MNLLRSHGQKIVTGVLQVMADVKARAAADMTAVACITARQLPKRQLLHLSQQAVLLSHTVSPCMASMTWKCSYANSRFMHESCKYILHAELTAVMC